MRHEGCRAACQSAIYTNRTRPQSRSFPAASIATASGTAHKRSCESGTPQRFLRRRRHVLVSSAVPPSSSPPRRRGLPHDPRQPAPWAPRGRFPRGRQRFLVGASAAQRDPPRSDTTHPIRRLVCLIPHFRGGGSDRWCCRSIIQPNRSHETEQQPYSSHQALPRRRAQRPKLPRVVGMEGPLACSAPTRPSRGTAHSCGTFSGRGRHADAPRGVRLRPCVRDRAQLRPQGTQRTVAG